MAQEAGSNRTREFNLTILLSALLAAILAVLILGLYYGCAHSSRPERPSSPPRPSGMMVF